MSPAAFQLSSVIQLPPSVRSLDCLSRLSRERLCAGHSRGWPGPLGVAGWYLIPEEAVPVTEHSTQVLLSSPCHSSVLQGRFSDAAVSLKDAWGFLARGLRVVVAFLITTVSLSA